MLLAFALLFLLKNFQNDPISIAMENYLTVETYSVTLRSQNNGLKEEIKYYYKKPGYIRMEFIKPYKGAVLIYNPFIKKVKLRPLASLNSIIVTLDPDNPLIKSSRGHRVDESDIGSLLKQVETLQSKGKTEIIGNENIGQRQAVLVSIKGINRYTIYNINQYLIWLDKEIFLPLKVSAYNLKREHIETVIMDDLKININLPDTLFTFGNKSGNKTKESDIH